MWALIPFIVSLVLLGGFVWFRMWEEKRGHMLWATERAKADEYIQRVYENAVTKDLPATLRVAAIKAYHFTVHAIVHYTVMGLRAAEKPLSRLSMRLRRNIPQSTGKAPSDFLKTLTPDKKPESENTTNTI